MTAANDSQGETLEALKGMTERPQFVDWTTTAGERGVQQTRHSQRRLRARIEHPPYDSRPVEHERRMGDGQCRASQTAATHSKVRPCSSCCSYCRCRSARSLDGAARTLVPMRCSICVSVVQRRTVSALRLTGVGPASEGFEKAVGVRNTIGRGGAVGRT